LLDPVVDNCARQGFMADRVEDEKVECAFDHVQLKSSIQIIIDQQELTL
jgi:hypothetical protein